MMKNGKVCGTKEKKVANHYFPPLPMAFLPNRFFTPSIAS
jgi:hypothetical protein